MIGVAEPAKNHLTEAEVEQHPDAIAGRALLEDCLKRYSPEEVLAFREAVRRCFASSVGQGRIPSLISKVKEAERHPTVKLVISLHGENGEVTIGGDEG